MAYQNVATPRFYVSWGDWYRALGFNVARLHTISPYIQDKTILPAGEPSWLMSQHSDLPTNGAKDITFLAGLNHNCASSPVPLHFRFDRRVYNTSLSPGDVAIDDTYEELDQLGQGEGETSQAGVNMPINYSGFSIVQNITSLDLDRPIYPFERIRSGFTTATAMSGTDFSSNFLVKMGCFVFGKHYDMPQNPNLSLTKSIDYGETKEITTYNGSSISNTMATGTPAWGNTGAWELGVPGTGASLTRSGRRKWDLTFSFLDADDMWGSNQSISNPIIETGVTTGYHPIITGGGTEWDGMYEADDMHTNDGYSVGYQYNLLTDDNFFSQVWHKTLGGTLPFIFQPDKDNNHGDQFAICKFVSNSLKVTQSAFHVYDVSVSIEEVW